jgi:hypothetical protein
VKAEGKVLDACGAAHEYCALARGVGVECVTHAAALRQAFVSSCRLSQCQGRQGQEEASEWTTTAGALRSFG